MATSELESLKSQLNIEKLTPEQKRDAILVTVGLVSAATLALAILLLKQYRTR